jgi:prophage regulatory protein
LEASLFIRIRDVVKMTGYSRSSIYRLMSRGKFPKPIHVCDGRSAKWLDHEVKAVVDAAIAKRGAALKARGSV